MWMLWIVRARHLGLTGKSLAVGDSASNVGTEVLSAGGWLTHGDVSLDTDCDFTFLKETRHIPARSQHECAPRFVGTE